MNTPGVARDLQRKYDMVNSHVYSMKISEDHEGDDDDIYRIYRSVLSSGALKFSKLSTVGTLVDRLFVKIT